MDRPFVAEVGEEEEEVSVESWREVEAEGRAHVQEMKTKFALRVVNVLDKHY